MRVLALLVWFAAPVRIANALPVPPPSDDEPAPPPEEPEPPPAEPPPAPPGEPPAEPPPTPEELAKRIDDIEDRAKRIEPLEQRTQETQAMLGRAGWLSRYITAFIDVGAFAVGGNGSGIRSDTLHVHYPQYRNTVSGQWVFMGDPLSTAINALGEPADTSDSRVENVDTINSSGRPSVIVNSIGLAVTHGFDHDFGFTSLVEFLPRPGPDQIDVELAHVDYRPTVRDLVISIGKIDSVLGIEYRAQDATHRITVTPSLIWRYTGGRPLGVRAHLDENDWSISGSVTNGDEFAERFEPHDELKANRIPSAAGHLQWRLPVGRSSWLGASAMAGPQEGQSSLGVHQWHYGVDAKLDLGGWDAVAEFVQGRQQGSTSGDPALDAMLGIERPRCDVAACLTYKGAYLLVDRRIRDWLEPYVRVDWRDAVHQNGAVFVYQSHTVRTTVGLHVALSSKDASTPGHIIGKIEYTWNRELGVPQFPHDVITSSIVVTTE